MQPPGKVVEIGEESRPLATLDHIIPSSKGGKSNIKNLVLACMPCNVKKSDNIL